MLGTGLESTFGSAEVMSALSLADVILPIAVTGSLQQHLRHPLSSLFDPVPADLTPSWKKALLRQPMKLSTGQQLRLQWTPMGMMHPQVCATSGPQLRAEQAAGCIPPLSSGYVLHSSGLFAVLSEANCTAGRACVASVA